MNKPNYYQSKLPTLQGSNDKELFYEARQFFRQYDNKRRLPYIRSKYFNGQKVFLSMFYKHLSQKSYPEQRRRIKFLPAAIDLVKNSKVPPIITGDGRPDEYYRFQGLSKNHQKFAVQIMKDKKQNRYFMSCFPLKDFK